MSSPDQQDLQLSFFFGNGSLKPQNPCITPEDVDPHEYYPTETMCLSRTELKHVAESILRNGPLKYLYLEGNQLTSIPDSLFVRLPNLLWLDLRNNQIASLPAEIGLHRSLKTLLLEGNPISELPPELGNVITLRGLNLRNCPISLPPQDIVKQGLKSILQYLRSTMAERPLSTRKTPPALAAPTLVSLVELPVVEKLQLSELMGSSMEEQDESVDDDELQRFRELKQQMILLDNAELGSIAQVDQNPKSHVPITKRIKAPTKAGIIPVLPLFDTQPQKRPEERRQAVMKELKEKKALLEQRRKSQEACQKWRTQSKIAQEKKISRHKQKEHERQKKREETDTDSKRCVKEEEAEARSARRLQQQIHAHVEKMQERRRNPTGTTTEQMAEAEQDLEEMNKLQARLLERRRNQGRDLEKHFTVFTGDTWQSFFDT